MRSAAAGWDGSRTGRRDETWRLGFLLGGIASAYFGANAFIPDFLHATGRSSLTGVCLTVLNAGQLPASLAAGWSAPGGVVRREPFLAIGTAMLGSITMCLLRQDWALILGAGLLGACSGFALVFCLSLPPNLSPRGEVHRLSAGMFAIGYSYSFAASLVGGVAWDLSRAPAASFLPVGLGALTILGAASWLRVPRAGV